MKKLIVLIILSLLLTSTPYVEAADIVEGMVRKGGRGIINLVTGIFEIPAQIYKGYKKGFEPIEDEAASKVVGTVLGIFRGFGHAAGRMSWGALEIVGFWTANHEDNKGVGIPLDAEYSWEMGKQYSIFEPTLEEGVQPIGKKLGRGLANTFVGIAELPGQTLRGSSDGNIVKGLVKGIWFFFSREVYGLGSIFTCIVPNPETNPGYAFNTEWPWETLAEETR